MNNFEYKNLTPFKWFVLENFPFIEADFDALTNWQLFCKLGKEMNKIINSENILGTQMENVTNAFIKLQNYVDNYFENLDVQDEINNKLNEMAESGELTEIISKYLQLQTIYAYDSIAELKQADNLVDGSYCETFGYYAKNDGGNAKYKIRTITNEDIVDNKFIIALNNKSLIAELIIENNTLNAKQFGCKGDGITDDTENLQYLFNQNNYNIEIPNGNYLISSSININNFSDKTLNFNNSVLNYNGNDYCIIISKLRNMTIHFGIINAENGGCIKFICNKTSDFSQYLNIDFINLSANENYYCLYAYKTEGWINEIRVSGGRLSKGLYGVVLETADGSETMDGWKFYNIGIEGVKNGFWFNAIKSSIIDCSIFNPRYAEFNDYTYLIKTTNLVYKLQFYGSDTFFLYKQSLSSSTNNCNIYAPCTLGEYLYNGGIIMGGIFIPNENRFPLLNGSIINLKENDDLNNFTIPGTYTSSSNAVTSTIVNKPSAINLGAFKLFVVNLNGVYISSNVGYKYGMQIILWQNGRIFTRGFEGTSFTSWKEITRN